MRDYAEATRGLYRSSGKGEKSRLLDELTRKEGEAALLWFEQILVRVVTV